MAKAKASPPKKGKKSTSAKAAATVPRRSPRRAVQSAKKLAAEDDGVAEEVSKPTPTKKTTAATKTTPKAAAKKATAAKVTKKSPSPRKTVSSAAKKKVAIPKITESTSPKRNASSTHSEAPPTSPKRGRPKKDTKSTPAKSQARPRSPSKVSSRTRSQTPDDADLNPGLSWTDSPKKRSPTKTSTKKAVNKTASPRKNSPEKVIDAEPTNVRKSIELPQAKSRSRSVSPVRKASASPVRGRNKTTASSKARTNSAVSNAGSTRAQSRSPVRKNSRTTETALALSQRAVHSPTKDQVASPRGRVPNRSQSPTKNRLSSSKRRGSGVSKSPTRQSVASPKQRGPSRSRSPTKSRQQRTLSATEMQSTIRSRSQSPSKANSHTANKITSNDAIVPSPVQSPRPRGRPRNSSLGRPPSPIQVNKTRSSRSPVKTSSKPESRSRSVSPKKSSRTATASRRLSDPSPPRERGRATTPSKDQTNKGAFLAGFKEDNEYGDDLRKVEDIAYKTGVSPGKNRFPMISDHDRQFAIEKGRNRAQLEKGLHAKGPLSKRKAPEPTHDSDEDSSSDELATKHNGPRRNAVAQPRKVSLSPQRRRSSGNAQVSPKQVRPRSQSPSKALEISPLLGPGEPSGKGRGGVESVTNRQVIPGTKTKNPFYESMPAAEVWHRRMPPFLPFGETPFMERVMSRQISEDLAKGAEKNQGGLISSIASYLGSKIKSPTVEERPYKSPWELPEVSDSAVDTAVKKLAHVFGGQTSPVSPKRKASEKLQRSPVKKARRRSHGEEPWMSGAL